MFSGEATSLPLSATQREIWLGEQRLDSGNRVYRLGEYTEIAGPVDPALFERALRHVVDEAEPLRVHFVETDDGPRQFLADTRWSLPVLDFREEVDPVTAAQSWADAELARALDLADGPLFRFALIQLSEDRFRWYQIHHHIVTDVAGMALIARRTAEVYTAMAEGVSPGECPFGSLRDALDSDAEYAASDQYAVDREFWRTSLPELPELIRLAERPVDRLAGSDARTAQLSPSWAARMRECARQAGVSWSRIVIAATALYLHGLSGSEDVIVGLPVAARRDARTKHFPGVVSNLLPLRIHARPDATLAEFVAHVAAQVDDALAHQRYRTEDIRLGLASPHNFRAPFGPTINIMPFGFGLSFAGHHGERHFFAPTLAGDLAIYVWDQGDGNAPHVTVRVPAGACAPGLLDLHQRRFASLLEDLVSTAPDRRLSQIELLLPGEREQLLLARNNTAVAVPAEPAPALFEAQTAATPDAIAVVFGRERLTYRELNARANRLAHRLIERGVGPEEIVALMLPRSIDWVTAVLAVWKTGAAYLPVDPGYPARRIAFMLDDARPALVLTADELPDSATAPDVNPHVPLALSHPAYVIYTSGSTGTPKGVVVSHNGIASLVASQRDRIGVGPDSRVLQFASPSFDASFWELCLALFSGGTLVLAPADELLPGPGLVALIERHEITHVTLPPSALAALGGVPAGVTVVVAGETCPPELVTATAPGRRMVNAYGPTETTVCATMSQPLTAGPTPPPIGAPIANTQVYVLDSLMRPVPVGTVGELYVGGGGLARGYLNRPGLTATRFVANPYGPAGSRLYRTGDLARWTPENELEFLGRADHQVKVRGHRVEPGEIETVLVQHPQVDRAVVTVRDARLVAYLVSDTGVPDALRDFTRARLPEHMVPSAFVALEHIPLTPNGKIDRQALPAPEWRATGTRRPARDPREQVLCELFAEVLGADGIGIDDDFFDLGGHSLLATRLISRIRTTFGVEFELRYLFRDATVAGVAAHLDSAGQARPALIAGPRPDRIPLSFAQRRLWFLHQMEGPSATYNIPMGFRLAGTLDTDALVLALRDVVARQESLRTVFGRHAGMPYQHIIEQVEFPVAISPTEPEALPGAMLAAARHPFDLSREIPVRAQVFALAPDDHVLVLVVHHIAGDGWSTSPLARDLAHAYTARCHDRVPEWTPLPVQYADYTLWQHQLLGDHSDPDSTLTRQVTYWTDALAGLPDHITLPLDRPRPPVATYRGDRVTVHVDAELHQAIVALARRHGATVFMVLQAGLAATLTHLGAGNDIPIGSPIAGRTDQALDDLVGFFVNTLVLRADTSADPTFAELLTQVRRTALAAYDHQDLPFEHLVEILNPTRTLAHNPLFQVLLALQNAPHGDLRLPGLSLTPTPVPNHTAKFDLGIGLTELFDANGMSGFVEFSTDVFDAETVEALFQRWIGLLRQAVHDPDRRLSRLQVLLPGEREQLLLARNDTDVTVSADPASVLFEAQAAATPDATAVVLGRERLTYRELNKRANQLAHLLIDHGVGPEQIVALMLLRSIDWVVAVLAVWKTGAAYLPIDGDYPPERIAFMLDDAQPTLVLTTAVVDAVKAPQLLLDNDKMGGYPDSGVGASLSSQHPAYVIYTSGSTGVPKGVVVTHTGVASLVAQQRERLGVDVDSHVLQFASPSFDSSFWELVLALLNGGTLVLASKEELLDGPALTALIERHGVTHVTLPPSALAAVGVLPDGVTIVVAGEACPPDLVALHAPGRRMLNGYGPTETTVCATMSQPLTGDGTTPPIGTPMVNTQVYLLDTALRPVPVGAPGEIYVGGDALARGYLNRPGLTATRFVANPYGTAGSRLYRTGDRARWTRHHTLEFLGRIDQQVKVRGYRVEPGEIEAALARHPGVGQAVVALREDRLVAYLRPAADSGARDRLDQDQLADWQRLSDSVYGNPTADFGHDFTGWNSTYDGEPIPLEHMREWRDATVDRIRRLGPDNVLEIGAGAGLLLAPLASGCTSYRATDLSATVIATLNHHVANSPELAGRVVLRAQPAHDLTGLPENHFDTIILNSVTQYFPSAHYLLDVLTGLMALLKPGGSLFVGDVRNYRLQQTLISAAHAGQATRDAEIGAVRRGAEQAVDAEKELLADPEFIAALPEHIADLAAVDIQLKRGRHHNELTRYRYDAILHKGPIASAAPLSAWQTRAWMGDLDTLDAHLATTAPQHLRIAGIPNQRLTADAAATTLLRTVDSTAELVDRLHAGDARTGADPEALYELGESHGYRVAVTWSPTTSEAMDAVFTRNPSIVESYFPVGAATTPLSAWTNNPTATRTATGLANDVREYLRTRLPDYMIPSAFMIIEEIPLTPNGKIDRQALPAPGPQPTGNGRPARNAREQVLCDLFAEVLAVNEVGVDDDFFDLGGHSLLATRLISGIRAALGVELELRTFFDAPTVAGLAQRLDDTKQTQLALVARPRPDRVPLSFAQRRLWFLHQMEGPSATYNIPSALRLAGTLDVDALRLALRDVVARHESLRTVFRLHDGTPYQHILDEFELAVAVSDIDRDSLPVEMTRVAHHTFDLSREIPLHAHVFALAPDEHVVVLVIHHISGDGWSTSPLARDLALAYSASLEGRAPEWTPLPVQYADYALWQHQLLGDQSDPDSTLAKLVAYWKQALAGLPDHIALPLDRPRPPVASHRGDHVSVRIDAELHRAIAALARRCGASVFMVLHAGLAATLFRLGAGEDIPVGAPIAGRTDQALDDLVGFFVNTLVLRADTSGDPTFAELLGRTRETALAAYAHQDVPFEHLVEVLNPTRTLAHNPLFQVLLALQNAPRGEFQLPGLRLSAVPIANHTAKMDLGFSLMELHDEAGALDGMRGFVEFGTDVFDADTAEAIFDRWIGLLRQAVHDPDQRLSQLQVLLPGERERLLLARNDTDVTVSADTASVLFEAQAAATPDATAVVFGQEGLTYRELNAHANRLAHRLLEQGIGREQIVALTLPRSIDWVVAVLAVWKTGAAYLPIDPDYPPDRIALMIDDARPTLVLTADDLPGGDAAPEGNPHNRPSVHDPAYVIYTSGSTGTPKGVVVTHNGVSSLVALQRERLRADADSRVLQFASPSFDSSFWELVLALLNGGTLVLASKEELLHGPTLTALIERHGVTHVTLPPSALAAVGRLPVGVTIVVAGEACPPDLVAVHSPGRRMLNGYGPTEATVGATMSQPLTGDGTIPPIGTPIPNTQVYLLDTMLRPVPVGVPGEIYIGGNGVARGYLHRPALTATRFIANPYGATGSRLYRTGDRARWTRHNTLEFLGRTDHQVKLRGYRIEPGEIETVLTEHPQVDRAVVTVREDRAEDPRLVAYLVPAADRSDQHQLDRDQLADWQQLSNSLYDQPTAEFGHDFTGWNSTYDGEPIPLEHMREWRDATVDRIRRLGPDNVLEIGAGAGLLLAPLAPGCTSYWATDISSTVITTLTEHVAREPELAGRVTLRAQPAHDLTGLPENHFDTIILNSVTQYFPSADYLLDVLIGLTALLKPGGSLFIGDVRNYRLQRTLTTAAQAHQAAATVEAATVSRSVEQAMHAEKELLVDPEFFAVLPDELRVDIQLKRGHHHNELTRYRYDTIVRKGLGAPSRILAELRWVGDLDTLDAHLATAAPEDLRVTGIPNRRLAADTAVVAALSRGRSTGEIRRGASDSTGVEPEALYSLGERHGYRVAVTWSATTAEAMDAVFTRGMSTVESYLPAGSATMPLSVWTNNPTAARTTTRLVSDVRDHVRTRLPDYMTPSAFVIIDEIPLTPNGKVDRQALPAPDWHPAGTGQQARTPQEQLLCELFGEALGTAGVGIDDDFFELGGHSLLATRLIVRIRTTFNAELDLRTFFQNPTVAGVAEHLASGNTSDGFGVLLALRTGGRGAPLFCIHPAAGIGWSYYRLLNHLDSEHPVYAVQARGLVGPAPESIEQMAADYADQIVTAQPTGPYHLLGWSFGGLVAHAVATELQRRGRSAALVALLDGYPTVVDPASEPVTLPDERGLLLGLIDGDKDALGDGPVTIAEVVDVLRAKGGPLSTLGVDQIEAIIDTRLHNIRLAVDYVPDRLDGDLVLFASTIGRDDPVDVVKVWEPYVSGAIERHDIVSDHDQLMQTDSLEQFGPILAAKLRRLANGQTGV